jgi:hypothetical protein
MPWRPGNGEEGAKDHLFTGQEPGGAMSISTHRLLALLSLFLAGLLVTRSVYAQDSSRVSPHSVRDSTELVQDSSHVLVSAIKSISGEVPENEFFALNWRINYSRLYFTLANVDIALSDAGTDTVASPTSRLTEAGISANLDVSAFLDAQHRFAYKRTMFVGGITKIFNTEAYYGVIAGSIELHESPFFTSYFFAGYLRRFFPVTPETNVRDDGKRLADDNLYAEFLIHSSEINFFRYLAVKGGVLIPTLGRKGDFNDVQFRITIAVPVGQPITF